MRFKWCRFLLGLTLGVFSLSGGADPENAQQTSVAGAIEKESVGKEFAGSVVYLDHAASHFQITLPENPSTGFRCYLAKYDSQNIEPLSSSYQPSRESLKQEGKDSLKAIAGAGGTRTFVFQVKPAFHHAPQKTKIEFHYERPWASGEKIGKKIVTVYSS